MMKSLMLLLAAALPVWPQTDTGKLPAPPAQECSAKSMRERMTQASTSALSGFWQDYAGCANLLGMPSSVLLALRRAEQAGAKPDEALRQETLKLLKAPSPEAAYKPEECWASRGVGKGAKRFTSRLLGISVDVPKGWQAAPAPMRDQAGMIVLTPPAYAGTKAPVSVEIALIATARSPQRDLEQFVTSVLSRRGKAAKAKFRCPFGPCAAYETETKDVTPEEGGAHVFAVAFTRPEPEFPGAGLEAPNPSLKEKPQFLRMKGDIDYIVMLDSAESVYELARKDFRAVLRSLMLD